MSKKAMSSNGMVRYQHAAAETMHALASAQTGLTPQETQARLTRYGYNELEFRKRGPLIRFVSQFRSPLTYVLLTVAVVTAVLQVWTDAAVVLMVVSVLASYPLEEGFGRYGR